MIKEILTVENEENIKKLSIRCDEIDTKKQNAEMRQIILDLKHTLAEHKDGCGLAASQIGYDKRIFVINFNGDIRTFINPVIADAKGLTLNRESCLSIPGKTFIRPRHTEIMVMYQTPLGKTESRKMFGMAACVFQHELDHLDGLILSDVGLEIGEDFNHPNIFRWPFEKVVFINQKAKMYRISDLFYQLPADIGDRAKSVKINGMSFVCDLMDYIV